VAAGEDVSAQGPARRSLQIFSEQVKLVYSGALPAFSATVLNAVLLTVVLRHVVAAPVLLGWLAYTVVLTLLRWVLVLRYRHAPGGPEDALRWNRLYTVGTTLSGIGWGAGGTLLFSPDSIAHQIFLVFVLGGMVTGAGAVLPARMECFLSFFFPTLVPIILRFFAIGDEMHLAMVAMGSFFMLALYLAARRVHLTILSSLQLRFENSDLIVRLTAAKEEADTLNAGLCAEIAHRRETEEALRESEDQYSSLVHAARDVIFTLNLKGTIVSLNQTFEQITGWSREEWLGRPFVPLLHPEDVPLALKRFQEVLGGIAPGMFDLRVRSKEGAYLTGEFTATVKRKEDRVVSILGIARDITQRKSLEAQLRHVQKMDAVGQLAGGISHEFNNLLQIIKGSCSLLLARLKPQEMMRRDIEVIQQSADRAAELTRQLLTFSRLQLGIPTVVDVNALVTREYLVLERVIGKDIALKLELAPNAGYVKADPGQIAQVLLNLVNNARDAMPRGGTLTIGTVNVLKDGSGPGRPSGLAQGAYVALTVHDTGWGIPPEMQGRVFEPFFTTKEVGKGTGLGLSTSYGMVAQCGGKLEVDSMPGQGTTFTVYLPRTDDPLPVQVSVAPVDATLNGSETILLVEDEEVVRKLFLATLRSRGYCVLEAPDGSEALRVSHGYHGPIHLLLTDVALQGLNGRALADRLLVLRPDMKVLYVSAYAGEALGRYGVADSWPAFLQKPFSTEALLRKVRDVLRT
jgi:PAS domain S-box-containing protein